MTKSWLAFAALCATCLNLSTPALAQASDEAEVSVLATILAAEAGLSVTGRESLDFDRVLIPNVEGAECVYRLEGDNERDVTQNNVRYGIGPTPAGCAYTGNGHRMAQFSIECPADQRLILLLRARSSNVQGDAVFFETFDDMLRINGASRYDWNGQCTGEPLRIEIGGTLRIDSKAVPTEAGFYVGNITLEATYP